MTRAELYDLIEVRVGTNRHTWPVPDLTDLIDKYVDWVIGPDEDHGLKDPRCYMECGCAERDFVRDEQRQRAGINVQTKPQTVKAGNRTLAQTLKTVAKIEKKARKGGGL